MKISLIQPSRNNLKYLKWSYDSIRKNQGHHTVQICVADDFSDDGTWEWCQERMNNDEHFNAIRHEGPTRIGHTILYDRLVNEVAVHDLCMIFHADMYLCPGALDAIENHMYEWVDFNEPHNLLEPLPRPILKTIVSLTRIEPPLHPPGPEKVIADFGVEPENFNEVAFLQWFVSPEADGFKPPKYKTTDGIFAPWAFWKSEFQEIGGHDPLYAPQSKEDSDIFNRFLLYGINFIQTWEGYVYHMTCRGSRFNPSLTTPGTNSDEWTEHNIRSTRNFIRKWGTMVRHTDTMKPMVPHKYDIAIIVHNCTHETLLILEPWCSNIYVDCDYEDYIRHEQPNTKYDLRMKIHNIDEVDFNVHDIYITVRRPSDIFHDVTAMSCIMNMPELILDAEEVPGTYEVGSLLIDITNARHLESELIYLKK